jgi:MGT family glycosyltransferase
MSLNFLFAAWGNPGNLNPTLTAARRLRKEGHRVRIIGEASHQDEMTKAGFDSLCWRRPGPLPTPEPGDEEPIWAEIRMGCEQLMFGSALDVAADTMDALRKEQVDAVITNDFLAGPVIAAEASGIPCALLAPHISLRPLDGIPIGIGCPVPNTESDGQLGAEAARVRLVELMNGCLPTLNRARAGFGLPALGHIFEHFDRASRVLLGISAAFDFPAIRLPSNLRYVGPLLDPPAWSGAWTAPWAGSPARPRVLVSLSTSFQNQAMLLRRLVAALGSMELDAIVTVGPAMEGQDISAPDNISVVRSAPHDAVMKEVSLVVTHGGHGTVMRSLLNGVPLLVIPMGRDQNDNAARVVARGAGLAIAENASDGEIVSAVTRLVTELHFRAAAVRLGYAIAPDVTSPVFVTEMEAIATQRWRQSA